MLDSRVRGLVQYVACCSLPQGSYSAAPQQTILESSLQLPSFVTRRPPKNLRWTLRYALMNHRLYRTNSVSTKLGQAQGLINAEVHWGRGAQPRLDVMIQCLGIPLAFRILELMVLAAGLSTAWFVKDRYPMSASFIEWRFGTSPFSISSLQAQCRPWRFSSLRSFFPYSLGLLSNTGPGLLTGSNSSTAVGPILSRFLFDLIRSPWLCLSML